MGANECRQLSPPQQPEPEPSVASVKVDVPRQVSCGLAEVYARCQALDCIHFQLPAGSGSAGNVLAHASSTIEQLFRESAPMVFKIGWTHDAAWRWCNTLYGYLHDPHDKWQAMVVLYLARNPDAPAMLEAALIDKFQSALSI